MSFHRGIGVLAVALLVSASAGAAFAGAPYTLTDLGTIGGGYVSYTPMGVAKVGGSPEVVGLAQTSGAAEAAAWYWTPSSGMVNLQTQLGTVLSSVASEASAVNPSGQIVGSYSTDTPGVAEDNGFVYTIGGTPIQMGSPGNTNPGGQLPNNFYITETGGLNSSGMATGSGTVGIMPNSMAFTYNVNNNLFTDVSQNSGVDAVGYAINNNGWIAGWGANLTTGTGQDAPGLERDLLDRPGHLWQVQLFSRDRFGGRCRRRVSQFQQHGDAFLMPIQRRRLERDGESRAGGGQHHRDGLGHQRQWPDYRTADDQFRHRGGLCLGYDRRIGSALVKSRGKLGRLYAPGGQIHRQPRRHRVHRHGSRRKLRGVPSDPDAG